MTNKKRSEGLTRAELANRLDVHQQTLKNWERDGMPIKKRGSRGVPSRYDLQAVVAWTAARDLAAQKAGSSLSVERARKERTLAMLAEPAYRAKSGQSLSRTAVLTVWGRFVTAARARMLAAWTTTRADQLHRTATLEGLAAVERVLDEMARELLREFETDPFRTRAGCADANRRNQEQPDSDSG